MSELSKKDVGIIQTLVEKFEKQRLPRLLELKEKIDNGNTLEDVDVEFLDKVIDDANRTMPLTQGNQELRKFCMHVAHLYKEITEKALENEKNRS